MTMTNYNDPDERAAELRAHPVNRWGEPLDDAPEPDPDEAEADDFVALELLAEPSDCKACFEWQFSDGLQCLEHGYEG